MLKNTENGYGWLTIVQHWVMAFLIIGMFALGVYMVDLSYYHPWYRDALTLHKSVGICLMLLFLCRILWRYINISPTPVERASAFEVLAAHLMHLALYGCVFLLLISGYLISTADGRGIAVFDLFTLPALPFSFRNQEDLAGEVHEILAWLLIGLASLHALAALKHQFVNRDGGLMRMIRSKKGTAKSSIFIVKK